ncbi:MAG: gamma-glutamyltransferase [Acidobacteriota bacterium]
MNRRPGGRLHGIAGLCLALWLLAGPAGYAAAPDAPHGTGGAVASAERQATEVGLATLRSGGNAVDAAVATALALAVTFPEAGNLGGGGFAVVKLGNEISTLDFREVAPAGASRDMYLGPDGEPDPDASLIGPLAAGVPGSPVGLWALHRRFGELPWKEIVEPARRLAAEGFEVGPHLQGVIDDKRELLARFPESAAVWLPNGEPPPVGSRLVLPDLAASLAAYGERGPAALTRGAVAEAIATVSRRHGGMLTTEDLAAYAPVWREPVRFEAFGWQIAAMDLPSSGGILLGQTLGMLERRGWREAPRFGADRAHLLTEAWRRAYSDRFLMGDPTTTRGTADDLLADEWLDERATSIDPARASDSDTVGRWSEARPEVVAEPTESGDTTHLSVIDGEGRMVALTTTLNGLFGCGLWVPGAGFFLNNEMDDFAAAPGAANDFGLVQGEANAVAPGKRMLSSMTPTIAWRQDRAIALGGRGGSKIPSNTIQVLLHYMVDDDPLQTAVNRPRLHHQWLPDRLLAEPDALAPETRAVLQARGHRLVLDPRTAKIQAVAQRPNGEVEAAVDPRGPGFAAVVSPSPE